MMRKKWDPEIKNRIQVVSRKEYDFLIEALAEILYKRFCQRHQNQKFSTVPANHDAYQDAGRTGTDG